MVMAKWRWKSHNYLRTYLIITVSIRIYKSIKGGALTTPETLQTVDLDVWPVVSKVDWVTHWRSPHFEHFLSELWNVSKKGKNCWIQKMQALRSC